ncbi:MAG: hypothetical protein ACK502_10400 [Alphaproteobacteria bacterium]
MDTNKRIEKMHESIDNSVDILRKIASKMVDNLSGKLTKREGALPPADVKVSADKMRALFLKTIGVAEADIQSASPTEDTLEKVRSAGRALKALKTRDPSLSPRYALSSMDRNAVSQKFWQPLMEIASSTLNDAGYDANHEQILSKLTLLGQTCGEMIGNRSAVSPVGRRIFRSGRSLGG